jgi:hypothetical protein
MAKLVEGVCHFCCKPIFRGEKYLERIRGGKRVLYHKDHGVDCEAAEEKAYDVMCRLEAEYLEVDVER